MAKTTNTKPVEAVTPVVGKAVTEKLSTKLTGVHATFSLLLDEIKTNNKISNGLTLDQLKLEKKGEEDTTKNKEQFDKMVKGLKEINDTLKNIKKSSTGTPISGKGSAISAGLPKAATNLTLTEKLKSVVGGVKSAGNKFAKVSGNIIDTLGDPESAIKKAYGSSKGVIKGALGTAKDILSTKADYSVEQERFAAAYERSAKGKQIQKGNNRPSAQASMKVGAELYEGLKSKQEEISKVKEKMALQTEQGFKPLEKDKEDLAVLEKQLAKIDPRVQDQDKKSSKKDKIESKVSSKAEQDPSAVSAPSGTEDLLKEIKANSVTLGSLLSVSQAQLLSINAVKEALAPSTPKEIVEQKSAPSAEAAAPVGGKSIGDAASEALSMLPDGSGKSKPGKKGMGGRILSGLGKAARFLGPAAAVAGAAYSGFEGYQNTGANFDVEEGKEATTGQKVASTLGGVASGLTFGLLDEKNAAQGIHKAGSAVKDFFGFGDKEKTSDNKVIEGGSDLEALQAKRDKLAKQGPATNSPQSIKAHETLLNTLDKAIEDKKNSKPSEGKLSEAKSVTPTEGESKSKVNSLEAEATKLGIDPNNAKGTYEGGTLTKITDKVSGKEHQIAVPEESKARVEAARNLKGNLGSEVAKTSTENADMAREASTGGGGNNTVVSNNVNNAGTTKFVPMKATPRPEYTGSSLDRYTNRITVY